AILVRRSCPTRRSSDLLAGTLILVAGIRYWQLFMLAGGAVAGFPLFLGTMQGYMWERITVFLDPSSDRDAAFNIDQALIAIGNRSEEHTSELQSRENLV